ncbi:Hypothetical predicted protein [Mytilus galloprovincialis]|uniref:Uncharacterized protein n=1 Tax=Mytilus galloprovincialis TaxID=29158 RepID=A0A8B6DF51_MYTGA|nr:Hypothetical predicted protein [Mytilus galloprovincialis]
MEDMKQFLKTDSDRILGIDRTFNLGAVFVTNFVYKNIKVINKETGDHPIFVGPMYLHWEGSFLSYHTFLSHVKARLSETVQNIDIRIGSDDESGLTKAIDDVFPGIKPDNLSSKYSSFANYFNSNLRDRLEDYVRQPKVQLKHDRLWTNNNCESMNHVFKKAVEWKPQPIPDLAIKLMDIVRVQLIDLKRSLYGMGNYELFGPYRTHVVSYQCWFSKTQEQRERLFRRLLIDTKSIQTTTKSSCSDFEGLILISP